VRKRCLRSVLLLCAAVTATFCLTPTVRADSCASEIDAHGCIYTGPPNDADPSNYYSYHKYYKIPLVLGSTYTLFKLPRNDAPRRLDENAFIDDRAKVPASNQDLVLATAGFPGYSDRLIFTFIFTDPTTSDPAGSFVECFGLFPCSFTFNGYPPHLVPGGQQAFLLI
jgi:hypothetical protein